MRGQPRGINYRPRANNNAMTKKEQIDEAQAAAAARDTAEKDAENAHAAYCAARDACNKAANKDAATYF